MATFLDLVNDVIRESGTMGGGALPTVDDVTGRAAKVVGWTRQAWEMIQRERSDWTFRRNAFSHALTTGETTYTAADLGLTDFAGWPKAGDWFDGFTVYDPALGRGDETRLSLIPYRNWLDAFDRGVPDQLRPIYASYSYGRELVVGPPPDKAYTLRGWYRRSIQSLAADEDEPYIDEEYHQAIVWRALMLLGDDDEGSFEVASSSKQYAIMHSAMLGEYLDPIEA